MKNFYAWTAVVIISLGGPAVSALAQDEAPGDAALPLPIQTGTRWLRYALLAPFQQPAPVINAPSAEASELEGVRERVGGGIFRGTLFDGNQEQDRALFQQALARWEAEQQPQACPRVIEWPAQPAQYAPSPNPMQAASEQLRVSARNLDSVAADLEDAGKYAEADRLRASAKKLRREAREFAQPQQ
jgi:hypothetical protein